MGLTGWIAYLGEHPDTAPGELADHLEADAERLQRVAQRFERIGLPARREPVALRAVAERVVGYFRPRLPRLERPVRLVVGAARPGPTGPGGPGVVGVALQAG